MIKATISCKYNLKLSLRKSCIFSTKAPDFFRSNNMLSTLSRSFSIRGEKAKQFYVFLFFDTSTRQHEKRAGTKRGRSLIRSQRERASRKLKGKHDSIFFKHHIRHSFSCQLLVFSSESSLIHIWCSRLSFLQTLANLSTRLIYLLRSGWLYFLCRLGFCQWNNINFHARCNWKINHKSMSEVFVFRSEESSLFF